MEKSLAFLITFLISISIVGQDKSDCPILNSSVDTVICVDKNIIVELNYCESNNKFQYGLVTDMVGNEEFCFFYHYNKQNDLKKITFWTFNWNNGGFSTDFKVGVLKINGEKQKLKLKGKFKLNHDFVKIITKT